MAKIVFINAYETSYLGTRILASYMLKLGHKVHNILLAQVNISILMSLLKSMKDIKHILGENWLSIRPQHIKSMRRILKFLSAYWRQKNQTP